MLKLNSLGMHIAASFLFPSLTCFTHIAFGEKQKPVLHITTITQKEKQRYKLKSTESIFRILNIISTSILYIHASFRIRQDWAKQGRRVWCLLSCDASTVYRRKTTRSLKSLWGSCFLLTPAATDYDLTLVVSIAMAKLKNLLPFTLGPLLSFNSKLLLLESKGWSTQAKEGCWQCRQSFLLWHFKIKADSVTWENATDTKRFPS